MSRDVVGLWSGTAGLSDTLGMTRPTAPPPTEVAAGIAMIAVAALTVVAGVVADPPPGASPWVLTCALVTAVVLLHAHRGLDPGWLAWRRATLGLLGVTLAYPAVAAALALAASSDPTSSSARLLAALATVGHVPVIGALSLLPLLAVRYIGDGLPPRLIAVVLSLATLDLVALALLAPPMWPVGLAPLWESETAVAVGLVVNLVFLGSTLVGPVVATRAARDAVGEARPRLVLVALAALSGPVLVLGCGVLGALAVGPMGAEAPAVMVLCGMYAALATVSAGTSRALRSPLGLRTRTISRLAVGLVALIAGLVAVTVVVLVDADGTLGSVLAALLAVAVMVGTRPLESWVAKALVSPALDRLPLDRSLLHSAAWDPPAVVPPDSDGALDEPEPCEVGEGREPIPAPAESHPLPVLSPREREVLALLAEGLSNAGTAARLVLSERTVDAHLRSVFTKLALPESPHDNRRVHAVLTWHDAHQERIRAN